MKSLLTGLLWRFVIGICIAGVGILVSFVVNNWNIEYWGGGGFGMFMLFLAALPFMGGTTSINEMAWFKPNAVVEERNRTLNGSMNWVITTFLIGIINLLASVWMYHIHH